ncbi:MAG: 3-phosphoshikimate 1-carboxyvinyltransferase [Lachnospiraceae bacterium]|nr:3-phosphoshikimate 1-carboxyvinyltransferase [Lachnospiraceae bacterium]MCM1240571.1 3-phosphoshikimate 1-carboxyvinyltransferase [Lachnospiraceae bacterium]
MHTTYSVPTIYQDIQSRKTTADLPSPLKISVPGSKSITNRALLLATLANGTSTLRGVLFSDDSRHFLKCIQDLGFETTVDETAKTIVVEGHGGAVPKAEADQFVGSAGTAARFLTAYLGLSNGTYHMDASKQMRKRPMAPLLDSLKELGCEVIYDTDSAEGHFPFTLRSHGFQKDRISVNIDSSSQFLSALLIASCLSKEAFTTYIEGTHGRAYIDMTVKMMEQFGVTATPLFYCGGNSDNHSCTGCINSTLPMGYRTVSGQSYRALDYQVEPDVSAACYFYAMSPLLGIPVQVEHVHFDSLQGDAALIHILEEMGCKAADLEDGVLVEPPRDGVFHGITVDLSACSDQAITLAAIAPYADSPTTITGIGHIRFQESDRITAIVTELRKMGIRCEETESSITIWPGQPTAALIETYDDHRMAMGFSLTGLRSAGIVINDPDCCKKTFEEYFDVLDRVAGELIRFGQSAEIF